MPIEQTLGKVEQEIASGELGAARDRLHGLLSTYPGDLTLRRRLGDIYWRLHHPAMAGRYWYLEEDKSPEMSAACEAFERSCGNDPLRILLALKFKGDMEEIRDTVAGRELLRLRDQVRRQYGYEIDLQRRGAGKYQLVPRTVARAKALMIGTIVALIMLVTLAGIGLYNVLTWLF